MAQIEYSSCYLFPATIFVTKEPYIISTILGSCVSVCLWDSKLKFGGMNHFMLPFWNGNGLASPKFGNVAIKKLYERMLELGCRKETMVAKIFGGGEILQTTSCQFNIGQRNIEIAREYIMELNIQMAGASVGGVKGRKIIFDTHKGTIIQRYIDKTI